MTAGASSPRDDVDVLFLHPGAQTADDVLARLLAFVDGAQRSLDLAVYDAYLDDGRPPGRRCCPSCAKPCRRRPSTACPT